MTAPTITEFISARLDEWEQSAREATPGPWSAADEHGLMPGTTPAWCVSQMTPAGAYVQDVADIPQGGDSEEADAGHIAMHDPAATLALVAALRAVVGLHDEEREHYCPDETLYEYYGHNYGWGDQEDYPQRCPTLRHIAAIWADHPEYDGSWAL